MRWTVSQACSWLLLDFRGIVLLAQLRESVPINEKEKSPVVTGLCDSISVSVISGALNGSMSDLHRFLVLGNRESIDLPALFEASREAPSLA